MSKLRCPDCHNAGWAEASDKLVCSSCGTTYPIVGNRPILLGSNNALFSRQKLCDAISNKRDARKGRLKNLLPGISVNLARLKMLKAFGELIDSDHVAHVLVVGGGTQRRWLDERFANFSNVELTYCDIDAGSLVDCYCDAHELAFIDESFDGVITTAV